MLAARAHRLPSVAVTPGAVRWGVKPAAPVRRDVKVNMNASNDVSTSATAGPVRKGIASSDFFKQAVKKAYEEVRELATWDN